MLKNLKIGTRLGLAFGLVLLLLAVSLYTLAIRHSLQARFVTSTLSALALGWVSAYGANMRTSHLPLYLAFFAMYAWAGCRSAAVGPPRPGEQEPAPGRRR